MKTTKSTKLILSVLAVILLTSIACTMGGVTVSKDKATIQVTLSEAQINTYMQKADSDIVISNEKLLEKIDSVELHEGYIRVFGEDQTTDGVPVAGSFDVSLSTENNDLKVQIIAVDIPGVDINDPRIVKANRELAEELSQSVRETNGEVLFKEVSVSGSGLMLTVEVPMKK